MLAFLQILQAIERAIEVHWELLVVLFVAVLLIVFVYRLLVTRFGPADLTGTGINVGAPKTFDNRSLSLMMEGLNTNLQSFNVVNQAATPSQSTFQQGDVESSSNSLRATGSINPDKASNPVAGLTGPGAASDKQAVPAQLAASPSYAIGAQDALVDQLNLAYQIFNQRFVTERAISDRTYHGTARRQVVLGFQISIDPPEGSQDCAAVAEIGLEFEGSSSPISIVALIPQEKTYNVASYSSSATSIDGSIVSPVKGVSGSSSRRSDHLYLHRDSDTIAFERDPSEESGAFGLRDPKTKQPGTVFGWEFHPVLGRRTVSPGMRLMLAVVALPCFEEEPANLIVKTRAYWLTYNRKCQTTNVRWAWWPFPGRQGRVPGWTDRDFHLLSGEETEWVLNPKIQKISWVDTGGGTAVVLVEGRNFFANTEVIIGGESHNEKNGKLILKSDRKLQVHTTIEALGQGEAVLNGRYGASRELAYLESESTSKFFIPGQGIEIGAAYQIVVNSSELQPVYVTLCRLDEKPFLLDALRELPNPILYVNDQPLARPYKFEEWSSKWPTAEKGTDAGDPIDAVRLTAWAKREWLSKGAVLLFKIPFCGDGWTRLMVLESSEFILQPDMSVSWHGPKKSDAGVDLAELMITGKYAIEDQKSSAIFGGVEYPLVRVDAKNLLLSVPDTVLAEHPHFIVFLEKKGNFVLDVPPYPSGSVQLTSGS